MLKKLYLYIIIFLSANLVVSQNNYDGKKGYIVHLKVIGKDTLPHIYLREVIIIPPRKFKNKKQARRYWKLVYNLKKVIPYAKLANAKLTEINNHLPTLQTEKERKLYIKQAEKMLKNEFEDELKKLTISQGRLLIKLVDRETGETTYQLVKELKGSFSAFLWQSLARLFGSNLKSEYDVEGEDKMIEEIIILIENGQL